MAYRRSRKWAYYGRNDSYSRSANAEAAEAEGRFPRTRAAAHMGLSVEAFKAGCNAIGYHTREWHHVGKYATPIDYWDTKKCAADPNFWRGAATAYKSKSTLNWIHQRAAEARQYQLLHQRNQFRQQLERQRDCTRHVQRHDTTLNWIKFLRKQGKDILTPKPQHQPQLLHT